MAYLTGVHTGNAGRSVSRTMARTWFGDMKFELYEGFHSLSDSTSTAPHARAHISIEIDLISKEKGPSTPSAQREIPTMDCSPCLVGHGSFHGIVPFPELASQHLCWYPSGSCVLHSPVKLLQSEEKAVKGRRRVVQPMPCVVDFALLRSAL